MLVCRRERQFVGHPGFFRHGPQSAGRLTQCESRNAVALTNIRYADSTSPSAVSRSRLHTLAVTFPAGIRDTTTFLGAYNCCIEVKPSVGPAALYHVPTIHSAHAIDD